VAAEPRSASLDARRPGVPAFDVFEAHLAAASLPWPSMFAELVSRAFRDRRARAAEAYAESKVRVARYLETGDLADLFPER
jgi:hypothetical protein